MKNNRKAFAKYWTSVKKRHKQNIQNIYKSNEHIDSNAKQWKTLQSVEPFKNNETLKQIENIRNILHILKQLKSIGGIGNIEKQWQTLKSNENIANHKQALKKQTKKHIKTI